VVFLTLFISLPLLRELEEAKSNLLRHNLVTASPIANAYFAIHQAIGVRIALIKITEFHFTNEVMNRI
jgi:hypothetical protein